MPKLKKKNQYVALHAHNSLAMGWAAGSEHRLAEACWNGKTVVNEVRVNEIKPIRSVLLLWITLVFSAAKYHLHGSVPLSIQVHIFWETWFVQVFQTQVLGCIQVLLHAGFSAVHTSNVEVTILLPHRSWHQGLAMLGIGQRPKPVRGITWPGHSKRLWDLMPFCCQPRPNNMRLAWLTYMHWHQVHNMLGNNSSTHSNSAIGSTQCTIRQDWEWHESPSAGLFF